MATDPSAVSTTVQATAPTPEQAAEAIGRTVAQDVSRIPPQFLWWWLTAIGACLLLFIGYVVVADVSFHVPEAHGILNAIGDHLVWFLVGLGLPSPVIAAVVRR